MTDLALIRRLEAAAARAWPATVQRPAPGGWLLRATPGLDRGRSNCALTPCRDLAPAEIDAAISDVHGFAAEYGIRPGIQVSPLSLHTDLQHELDRRGWEARWPTLVMTGPLDPPASATPPPVTPTLTDHASDEWLNAWGRCEPGRDVAAHASTVFPLLQGRATFARLDHRAVSVTIEDDGLIGMFCVAVDPGARRRGLATSLAGELLRSSTAELAYLQVEERNLPARAMYERLGFGGVYRYCHRLAPAGPET